MLQSMTGFASQELLTQEGTLIIEIRSVNHRYLELQLKTDDSLRLFESMLRETIQANIGRGKLDCRIHFVRESALNKTVQVNTSTLQQLAEQTEQVATFFPHAQPINLLEVLKMPNVLETDTLKTNDLEPHLKTGLTQVLQSLKAAREREGEKLKAVILARLQAVEAEVAKVKPLMPDLVKQYQAKLTSKLNEAFATHDDERVRQEIVLFAQRIDIDEELARLGSHISEVKRILSQHEPAGKRLDFLMQEMNREANTLGAKSVAIETTQISMELKVLIEQMREQIQNIE
jgi:uncharacterized protein (TIGR00255 family)